MCLDIFWSIYENSRCDSHRHTYIPICGHTYISIYLDICWSIYEDSRCDSHGHQLLEQQFTCVCVCMCGVGMCVCGCGYVSMWVWVCEYVCMVWYGWVIEKDQPMYTYTHTRITYPHTVCESD